VVATASSMVDRKCSKEQVFSQNAVTFRSTRADIDERPENITMGSIGLLRLTSAATASPSIPGIS
jgi:hypothetical protein